MSQLKQDRIEELARLLDGEVTDRSSSEAQQLLVLADAVRDNAPELVRPTPAFRAQLRAQLVEHAAAAQVGVLDRVRETVRERTARWRYSARVATASATASLMIGSAGAAVAAQAALPGELLYPLKQATESARLALANSPEEVGRVQLDLARERLEEITTGVDALTASQVIDTLVAMDRHTEVGAEELLAAFDRTHDATLLEELAAFTVHQRSALTAVLDALPLEALPFTDRSFELLRRIDVQSSVSAALCDCDLGAYAERAAASTGGLTRGIETQGAGPAAPTCDDCTEAATSPARVGGLIPDLAETIGNGDEGTTAADEDPDGEGDEGGSVGTFTEPVEDLTGPVDDATQPVDDATQPVDDATQPITDITTDPINDVTEPSTGTTTEPITDTTEPSTGTTTTEPISSTTEPISSTTDPVGEVGDLLP